MPDLRQALKDFVATSNSGKYSDEKTLLSKFPELQSYDINVLRDFVATSNSGKYTSEDEVFSKFPEFQLGQEVKKKSAESVPSSTELPSEDGQLVSPKPTESVAVGPMGITGLQRTAEYKPKQPVQPKPTPPPIAKTTPEPTESLAVGPMGITGLQRTKEYIPAEEQGKQGDVRNLISSLDKGFYKNILGSPVKGLGTALEGVTGKGFVSDALIKFGNYFNKTIDEMTFQDEEFKNSLTDQFGQAFGQIAALVVTQGAAGALSKAPTAVQVAKGVLSAEAVPKAAAAVTALKTLGTELASPTAISAGLSMGQSEFDRAKEAGATDDQAFEAFYKNAAVGSVLEKIPVMQFFKRFNKASAGGVVDYLKTKTVAGLTGGAEEMTTEILQGIYSNLTVQDIYNANQDIFEGLTEAGGVGFGVGFLLNAMGANAKILRNQGKEAEANIIEQQIAQFENQAQRGGPSSYSVNGITIQPIIAEGAIQQEPRDIVSGMIDNMTATDLSKMNIDITNDPELNIKLQDKIVTSSIKEQVRESNPNLSEEQLDEVTNLEKELRKFEGNTTQSGKDKAAAIRSQIKTIQNAIQEQAASQVPVQSGAGVSETLAEGEPQAEPQVTPTEGFEEVVAEGTQEVTPVQEEVVSSKTQVNVAPYFNTKIETVADAEELRKNDNYKKYKQKLSELANEIGIPNVTIDDVIGGYKNDAGEDFVEISNLVTLENATLDQAEDFAALAATISPEVQEASIAAQYISEGADTHNANEYQIQVSDINGAMKALKQAGISNFSVNENTGTVSFIDVLDFADEQLQEKIGKFVELLDQNNINYEQSEYRPVESRYVDKGKRQEVFRRIKSEGTKIGQGRKGVYKEIDQAIARDAEFQGVTPEAYLGIETAPVVGEYNPTEEVKDKDMDVLNEVLTKKKVQPEAEPDITDFGDTVVFEYSDSNAEGDSVTRLTFNKNKNGEIVGRGVKVEKGVGRIKKTKLFKDFVNSQTQAIQEAASVVEAAPVEEVEQYIPIAEGTVSHDNFTKDNAVDYETDFKTGDNGRDYEYVSRISVSLNDEDGNTIGNLVKIIDEDKNVSWNAEDEDGNTVGKQDFDSKAEAQKALVEKANKLKKKEFDREAKILAKAKEKEAIKKAKATEKAAAKKPKTTTQEAPVVEEGPTAEDLASIDAMLDLDMEDEGNMLMVLNALDRADKSIGKTLKGGAFESLLAIPLSTVQVVIKALKVLVKGGMMLRDAIKKVAADNNLSQDSVKDILNIAPIQDGFNALMDKVNAMVQRQTARKTEQKRMVSNVDTLVRNSEVYQNATDAQKKILEREARTQAGATERRAPSIGRILGVLKDITNVSRKDKLKIISQIRQLSKDAAKDLAKEIKDLATQGKITVNQAANIVSRFGKVNMLSEISVSKFVDYMTKVFNDAEYNSKLGTAKSLKKDIKKMSKDKNKNANLRDLGQKFSEIDPSMVEDIDAYNEMAFKIKESIKGSSIRTPNVSFADMVNINNASEYISKTLDAQDKMMREEKAAEIQDLMGVDVSELSYDDMKLLLESKEPITKYNEGIIRSTINKAFNIYSSLIKETIATGKDPFTGEDVEFTKSQKDVVKRFMDMDLSVLEPKEALKAVDALANFLQNKSTARMETVVSESMGIGNGKKMYDKGIKAFKLQKYWSPDLGRILGEQVTALPVLFERLFKGFNAGGKVMDMIGLTNLFNKKSSAKTESNIIVENYVKEFYDKQANGEAFNSEYNAVERGTAAFMMRTVIGTEAQMNKEFIRRKNLILDAIKELKRGNDKEKAKAELYQKAYDKIVADSKDIKDISSKIDKTNLEAIDYWREQWANKYEQLSDVSQNVYNTVLEKDLNYIPDRVAKLSSDTGVVELKNEDSAFYANNGILYKEESGSLKKATRPDAFDKKRYIDLSFDNVNANAMYDALVDVNTAAPIRQVQAFLNSSYFEEIFPNSDDATIVKKRIQRYVDNTRGKNPYDNDELSKMVKNINRIAAIGVGQALGGITQPIKQVGPVAINTLINAGTLNIRSAFNVDTMNFLRESGYAIANRGRESQSQIESVNKLLDQASKSKGAKALKLIEQANEKWIEVFLVKPDVFIARASWMTYYEQNLNDQGVDTNDIDYKTHELNEEAANYAQRMVDRQQNVSDADLSGQLFSAKEPYKQVLVKILMPLSGFRMNQSTRLGADLATLTNKTSTTEDKKIAAKSVAGFGAELVTFRLLGIYTSVLLSSLAKKIMDRDEDDEEKKKRIDNIMKGAKTSTFTDIVSPFPLADKLIQAGGSALLDEIQKTTEIPISIFGPMQQSYVQGAGIFGIPVERALQLWELSKLTTTGKYTDNYGKEKTISDKNQDELKKLIPFAMLTNLGLAPSEVNTVVRYAIKDSKKKAPKTTEEKEASVEKAEDKEESVDQKTEALEKIKSRTRNAKLIEAIDEKIDELDATDEEKKLIKEQNKEERELKQELLVDPNTGEEYDNESKLKKYNKRLWIKNFGPNSDWYKEHRYEKEAESLMNKEIIKMEDKEFNYIAPVKKRRNSDGSLKRTYGKTKRSY